MNRILRLLKLASFAAGLILLTSCGGGGGNSTPGSTVISGIVSDDIIVGATVTATSLSTGQVLGTAITGSDGSFVLTIPTSQIGLGYSLVSSGGTMNGQPFSDNLSAIYPVTANSLQSNLTLLTSALTQAASMTQISGTLLDKFDSVKTSAIDRGLIGTDYYMVQPSGTLIQTLQNQAARDGASAVISSQANILSVIDPCNALNVTCKDVSSLGESLAMLLPGGATVSAPVNALSSCRVVASFDATAQSMTVRVENIPFNPLALENGICNISGNVTLTLPLTTDEAPGVCFTGSGFATIMPNCVTRGSGITPSYFVDGGDGYRHRTDNISHSSQPKLGDTIKLSRSYGAVLYSSALPLSGPLINPQDQWQGKTAVIFVHGFSLGGGFGGDDGTWGKLPKLVTDDQSVVALNFQWITDANYLTVAEELAKAVDYAYASTGNNKVHIVAHSFGGVLSRVMLQNLTGTTLGSAQKVATLTTVGTPHSGIASGGSLSVEGQTLPHGWGSWVPDSGCGQISCYQSGLDANIAQWAKNALACAANSSTCFGPAPTRGYINARLADFVKYPFPAGLKVNVLIGQIIDNVYAANGVPVPPPIFDKGDGLISYEGQRFEPTGGTTNLLSGDIRGGATVTERVLGLSMGVKANPGELVGNTVISAYTYGPSSYITNVIGYKHSSFWSTFATKWGSIPYNSEVNVPDNCGTAGSCLHDTWVDLVKFWRANGFVYGAANAPTLSPAFSFSINGLQASFDARTSTPSADITSYAWDFGDGATATGITAAHTYAAYSTTPWSVTLTVTDSYGRTANTSQDVSFTCPCGQVIVNGQCVMPATNSLSVCKSGSGAITSSPAGIDCGGVCSAAYAPGTQVNLNIVADSGWSISGISSSTSDSGIELCRLQIMVASLPPPPGAPPSQPLQNMSCTVTMDQVESVQVTFGL